MKFYTYIVGAMVVMAGIRVEAAQSCQNSDISMLMDFSGSEAQQRENQRTAVKEIINQFELSENSVNFAATAFSNYIKVAATLGDTTSSNNGQLINAVDGIVNTGVGTKMNLGLAQVESELPYRRPGVPQIVVISSDFVTENIDLVKQQADRIKNEGNVNFVCLVVHGADTIEPQHWDLINYLCDESDVHIYPHYQALTDDAVKVSKILCDEEVVTVAPTKRPTGAPTKRPTDTPTKKPTTRTPTNGPTYVLTKSPTSKVPSNSPSKSPSPAPTGEQGCEAAGFLGILLCTAASLSLLYPVTKKRLKERTAAGTAPTVEYRSPHTQHVGTDGKVTWKIPGQQKSTNWENKPVHQYNGGTFQTQGLRQWGDKSSLHVTQEPIQQNAGVSVDPTWVTRPALASTVAESTNYMTNRPVGNYEYKYSPLVVILITAAASVLPTIYVASVNLVAYCRNNKGYPKNYQLVHPVAISATAFKYAANFVAECFDKEVFSEPYTVDTDFIKQETLMIPVNYVADKTSPCWTPLKNSFNGLNCVQEATLGKAIEPVRNGLSRGRDSIENTASKASEAAKSAYGNLKDCAPCVKQETTENQRKPSAISSYSSSSLV